MSNLVEGYDYKFLIPEDEGIAINVELLTGEYSGVVYRYGKVGFEENEESGEGYLTFEYDLMVSEIPDLESDIKFKNYIGDVLVSIISKNVGNEKSEVFSE